MRFLFEVTREATAAAAETDSALEKIAQLVMINLNAAGAVLLVVDDSGTNLIPYGAVQGDARFSIVGGGDAFDNPVFRTIMNTRKPQIINDFTQEMRSALPGMSSAVAVPLLSGDDVIGLLGATKTERNGFNPASLQLLQTLSSTLAAIIHNARLLRQGTGADEPPREVEKVKNQFLANKAHGLRTTLNSNIGLS